MKRWIIWLAASAGAAAVAVGGVWLATEPADAADHTDPPEVAATAAADIADLYAWHNADGNIVVAMTYAGNATPADGPTYSRDVLYQLHIDNADADLEDNVTINVRFGQDAGGAWGVQFENVPGASGNIAGGVNMDPLTDGMATAWAGPRDDPFFFDFQGLLDTFANAGNADAATADTLAFSSPAVDFFAGKNAMLIVAEFPVSELMTAGGGPGPYNIWASTGTIQ